MFTMMEAPVLFFAVIAQWSAVFPCTESAIVREEPSVTSNLTGSKVVVLYAADHSAQADDSDQALHSRRQFCIVFIRCAFLCR